MARLCHINDIPEGKTRGFVIGDLKIIALKKDAQLYLYENSCPHLGLDLEFQPDDFLNYDETFLQCSTHGAIFTLDKGFCVLGPCKGESLRAISFKVDNGQIIVTD